jgi:hypothetical protein
MMKVERGPKTSPVFSTLIFLFQDFLKLKLPLPLYFPSIFGFSMVNYTVGPSGPRALRSYLASRAGLGQNQNSPVFGPSQTSGRKGLTKPPVGWPARPLADQGSVGAKPVCG